MPPIRSLALALLLLPALAPAQTLAGRSDATYTWQGPLRAGARLSVRNFNGPIDVRPATGGIVELRAEKRTGRGGGEVTDVAFDVRTAANGDVTICAVFRDRDSCDGDRRRNGDDGDDYRRNVTVVMTVLVPRGAQVSVATGNGAVSIERVGGEIQASTGNGRVRISDTDGPVRVSTGNGDVEVRNARARVRASTGNGDVDVVTSSGPVEARSGNGNLDVRIGTLASADDMTFSTGSGSVHLTLPPTYNGELEASTGNGEVRSDFDLKVKGRIDPRRVRATIGSGGPLLRLSSGNGRLEIRKGQ
jgi:Putative adhesin